MNRVYRVIYDRLGGVWLVIQDGQTTPLAKYPAKTGAVSLAKRIADTYQPSRLIIHHLNGRLEQEYTFRGELVTV